MFKRLKFSMTSIKNIIYHLAVSILVIILAFTLIRISGFVPARSSVFYANTYGEFPIGGIQGENIVIQTFRATQDVARIGVKMATYDRLNSGTVNFRVFDPETNDTYDYQTINASAILDNGFQTFDLQTALPARKALYAFELSGIANNFNESVGVWSTLDNSYDDGSMRYSDYETDGDLLFLLTSPKPASIGKPVVLTVLIALVLLIIINAYLSFSPKDNTKRQEKS